MKKIIDFGYKIILQFMMLIFFLSLFASIFLVINRDFNYLNPVIIIIGSILYLLFLSKIYKYLINLDLNNKKKIIYIMLFIQLILLIISVSLIKSVPKVDLIHIITELNSLDKNGYILNKEYFEVYPNNRFLLMFLYFISKVIPISKNILFYIVSIISVLITTLFTYKSVNKMFDINKGVLSLIIMVLSPIFYLYVSYYYTDILMLPFVSVVIYLMLKQKDKIDDKKTIIYGVLIGILSAITYKMRAVGVFVLIAYIIYLVINNKLKIKEKLIKIMPVILSFMIGLFVINIFTNNFYKDKNNKKEFPVYHWIMMGFNSESFGYYTQKDYELSYSKKNIEERKAFNKSEIKKRIDNLGVKGTTKLLLFKIYTIWSKGDYSYQKYISLLKDYNFSYKYLAEDKNLPINYLLQVSKTSVLLLAFLAVIKLMKQKEKSFILIALFGAVIFYLLWEVCPRYGLSFLPWLIILGSYSYDNLNFKYEDKSTFKITRVLLITLTVIIFIIHYNNYTTPVLRENILGKSKSFKRKYVSIENKKINQSIKVHDDFNEINFKLKFKDDNGFYNFKLYKDNKLIVNSNNHIVNSGYATMRFDNMMKKGNYNIELSSKNKMKAALTYKEMYDYYPEGTLKINGKKHDGDLLFEIKNRSKRPIYGKIEYVLVFLFIILLEYLILYKEKRSYEKK